MTRKDRSTEPYRILQATKLPRALDRRVKLSEADKVDIRERYKNGEGIRSIARAYEDKCTRRVIQYTLRPELYERMKNESAERNRTGAYKPSKAEWSATMREHRAYKKKVLTANL